MATFHETALRAVVHTRSMPVRSLWLRRGNCELLGGGMGVPDKESAAARALDLALTRLPALVSRCRTLTSRLGLLEETAAEIEYSLTRICEALQEADGRQGRASRRPQADGRVVRGANKYLREVAAQGIDRFELDRRADGRAQARIGGKELVLPVQLGRLLHMLASNDFGESDDGLVGWKPISDVAVRMSLKSSRRVTEHSVSHNIWRLRRSFERAGMNKFVIQTERARGARLALLRPSTRSSRPG